MSHSRLAFVLALRATAVATLAATVAIPAPAAAQAEPTPPVSHAGLAAANMVLGGLTAGTTRALQGGSRGEVATAFLGGALGGAAVYGGKAMVAMDPGPALGGPVVFTGRALAAVGASVTRNAGAGAGLADELILPAGMTRLHVRWRAPPGERVHLSVDLLALAGLIVVHRLHDDLTLDLPASLASGAPTFRTPFGPRDTWRGQHMAGSIVVIRTHQHPAFGPEWTEMEKLALRHERVHLLQYDQAFILWSDPREQALLRAVTGSDRPGRYLDLGLHGIAIAALNGLIPYRWRPWEIEAHSLAGDWGHWAH